MFQADHGDLAPVLCQPEDEHPGVHVARLVDALVDDLNGGVGADVIGVHRYDSAGPGHASRVSEPHFALHRFDDAGSRDDIERHDVAGIAPYDSFRGPFVLVPAREVERYAFYHGVLAPFLG